MKDYYNILGVGETATNEQIKKAFKDIAKKEHPDRGGNETKFKEADVVVMRIIGGEEIIARFIAQTEEKITVRKPLALVPTQTGLGMTNYIMMADVDDTVDFNLNAIVVLTKASKAASDNYTKSTSGIVPASAVPKLKV